MTPHRTQILSMLVPFFPWSFLRLGITLACIWNFAKIILGCINYFHNYVSEFMKKIPFSRSVESWHAYPYSTCRQVKISFLDMPQIAHFQVEKWKSSLPWEGGHPPHPPPARSLRSLGLGRFAPSQRLCPPKCFWLITPLPIGTAPGPTAYYLAHLILSPPSTIISFFYLRIHELLKSPL